MGSFVGFIFWFLLTGLCGFLAYRAIRGGVERPQWQRLNGFGVFGIALVVIYAAILVYSLFG